MAAGAVTRSKFFAPIWGHYLILAPILKEPQMRKAERDLLKNPPTWNKFAEFEA